MKLLRDCKKTEKSIKKNKYGHYKWSQFIKEFEGEQWGLGLVSSWFTVKQSRWHCQPQLAPGIRKGLGNFWGKCSKIWVHWGIKPGQEPTCQGLREVLLMGTSSDIHLLVQISLIKSLTWFSVALFSVATLHLLPFFFFWPHYCRACGILVNPHSPTKDGTWALSSERV